MYGRGRSRGGTGSPAAGREARAAAKLQKSGGRGEERGRAKPAVSGRGAGGAGRGRGGAGAGYPGLAGRASSRSPARGGNSPARAARQESQTKQKPQRTSNSSKQPPSPKAKAKPGKVAGKAKEEITETGDAAEKVAEEAAVSETEQLEPVTETASEAKPGVEPKLRQKRQKLPKLNDNPDAPEVVDVPNMRSSLNCKPERGLENGLRGGVNGSELEDAGGGAVKLLVDTRPPPALKPVSDSEPSGDTQTPTKDKTVASEDSEVVKDPTNSTKDNDGDILTAMIRENLNKAVNNSDDSLTGGNTVDMKKSLLDVIKNTLKSSEMQVDVDGFQTEENIRNLQKSESDLKENSHSGEVIANGGIVNGESKKSKSERCGLLAGEEMTAEELQNIVTVLEGEDLAGRKGSSSLTVLPPAPAFATATLLVSADGSTDLEPEPAAGAGGAIRLDQLQQGMVPVDAVQIEQIEADGTSRLQMSEVTPSITSNISVVVMEEDDTQKPKINIDKNKLFSQMNDKFAKDTHNALKHRPVYQKRNRQLPSPEIRDEKDSQSPPSKKKKKKDSPKIEKVLQADEKQSGSIGETPGDPVWMMMHVKDGMLVSLREVNQEVKDIANRTTGDKICFDKDTGKVIEENLIKSSDPEQMRETSEQDSEVLDSNPDNKQEGEKEVADEEEVESEEEIDDVEETEEEQVPEESKGIEKVVEEDEEAAEESEVDDEEEEEDTNCDNSKQDATVEAMQEQEPDPSSEGDKLAAAPAPIPVPSAANPELTKSLRKVRLKRNSPTKSLIKEKWEPNRDPSPGPEDGESGAASSATSPRVSAGGDKAGTEVFDFTDDEDIPLSNIDLDVLDGAEETAAVEPTLDHELSQLTPKPSPMKGAGRRLEVSPQILTALDAVAAVAALQVSPGPVVPAPESHNSEVQSDDTDTSTRAAPALPGRRKKRRLPESDGGETEDELEPGPGRPPGRPKRTKNVSGTASADSASTALSGPPSVRPLSAASATSLASTGGDKREFEEKKSEDQLQDGKETPDSQKSLNMDDKSLVKAFSTVVPEKASSFKIHPERTCGDCCFYCSLKFGMLDTPLHIKQLKTVEKQDFAMEFTGFTGDACLCDRCFRFLDRRAAAKNMNGAKNIKDMKEQKEEKIKKCLVRTCNRQVTAVASKKWLMRLKKRLSKKVGLDWDKVNKASVKATFPICSKHNALIDFYSNCGLCKRKLSVGGICTLGMSSKEVEEMNILLREDHIPADLKENNFVCKLCKTFCGIKQKSLQPDYLKNHKTHKAFYKDYRRKLYIFLELGEEDRAAQEGKMPKKSFKVTQSGNPGSLKITIGAHTPQSGEKKKKKEKDSPFASPSAESKIQVNTDVSPEARNPSEPVEKCAVNINFDMNTKKLWQELHYPYGSYTSFFRHLILLEKYWRSGSLALSTSASAKATSYLKSVQNRIHAYEGKQFPSHDDLSACTRPDLEAPAAPALIHVPGEPILANLAEQGGEGGDRVGPLRSPDSHILRIPRVPRSTTVVQSGPAPAGESSGDGPPGSPSPKIRVRQDLMAHLGLVARNSANIVQQERQVAGGMTSQLRAALTVTPAGPAPPPPATPNLAKLLSEGDQDPASPPLKKSSNSQLFKSTESSGAIPLTFNNSIAEVLAAASKAKVGRSRETSPRPEITITPKSKPAQAKETPQIVDVKSVKASSGSGKGPVPNLKAANQTEYTGHKLPASISSSPSPSGGALSILKRSQASTVSPLSNMSKLLATQAPGLPPHIIAQQALPARTAPKVLAKPPGLAAAKAHHTPKSQSSHQAGIQTVNKKSLTTVLDRLGSAPTSSPALSSSLVQQLQAPPMAARPAQSSKQQQQQFPDPASLLSQSLLLGSPNPAAAQAALMMAGLNGLSAQQAQQAMQELLSQQLLSGAGRGVSQLRAPPPLKHMSGGRGHSMGGKD